MTVIGKPGINITRGSNKKRIIVQGFSAGRNWHDMQLLGVINNMSGVDTIPKPMSSAEAPMWGGHGGETSVNWAQRFGTDRASWNKSGIRALPMTKSSAEAPMQGYHGREMCENRAQRFGTGRAS